MAADSGINVASGDVAVENVASRKWNAEDVYVIQDMKSGEASKLLDWGAKPFLITCFEAPLYAPFFYDNVSRIANKFMFSLGFGFSETQNEGAIGKNLEFRFPSFYFEDMREIPAWGSRKKLVLVAANKYKSQRIFVPCQTSLIGCLRQLKSASWQFISPAYRKSLVACLHDQRLEAIEYFAGELALYGSGWKNLNELPSTWVNRLKDVINNQYLGQCQDKLETISGYKFSVCYENMALPGYVTEKIVDCFVAGTIPLYLGAPDIETIIPAESFIDKRSFDSFDQLDAYMSSMQEHDAIKMVQAGRDYLQTETGILHSYEGFARNVIRLAKT
ncbi:MAG: glycosyltransferase family 10 [Pseudomonadota bacterium]